MSNGILKIIVEQIKVIVIGTFVIVRSQPYPNRFNLDDRAAEWIENIRFVGLAFGHDVKYANTQRTNIGAARFFFSNAKHATLF